MPRVKKKMTVAKHRPPQTNRWKPKDNTLRPEILSMDRLNNDFTDGRKQDILAYAHKKAWRHMQMEKEFETQSLHNTESPGLTMDADTWRQLVEEANSLSGDSSGSEAEGEGAEQAKNGTAQNEVTEDKAKSSTNVKTT